MKILVYGYGNPGRQDDGLGIIVAEKIEIWAKENKLNNVSVEQNYQLNIEDAEIISNFDIVFFVDATIENYVKDIDLTIVNPSESSIEFTMHAASPSFILDLCTKLYHNSPQTYLLHIKGYNFELSEGICNKAEENLLLGLNLLKIKIKELI